MARIARRGDIGVGTCKCHQHPIGMSGIVQANGSIVYADDLQVARVGDIVIGACGHTGIIVSGSSKVFAEGIQIARVGDSFVGCFTGIIVTGSEKTDSI